MWIEMLTDQIKAGGIYLRGQRLDPPESIVEQFDEGSYKKSCAPWDVNVPPEQLALREAEAKVKALDQEAGKVASDLQKFRENVSGLEKHQKSLAGQAGKAAKELEEAQKAVSDAAAAKADEEAVQKIAEEAAAKAEPPKEPVPPPCEDIGEAEMPKETKTDGPEKTEKQKPERKPPKKH